MPAERLVPGSLDVPEDFARLGYSGIFHTEANLAATPEQITEWEQKVPCLLPNRGWMALRVNRTADGATVTLVRSDAAAVVDVCTIPPPVLPVPAVSRTGAPEASDA